MSSLRTSLRLALRLTNRSSIWRGAITFALVASERVLGPALALSVDRDGPIAMAVGLSLCACFVVRSALQATAVASTEAELYRRVVASVLDRDVLQPCVVRDEDVRAGVFEGMHRSAGLLAGTLPHLAANIVSAIGLALVFAFLQPFRITVLAVTTLAAAGLLLVQARGWLDRAHESAWQAWIDVADTVTDAIDGRFDLVAAGRDGDFKRRFAALAERWSVSAMRAGRLVGAISRAPLVLLIAGLGFVLLIDVGATNFSWGRLLARAALFGSIAPPFLGVAHGTVELVRSERRLRMLDEILRGRPRSQGAAKPAGDGPRRVQWEDVRLSYGVGTSNDRDVLHGVTFTWTAGETLAITGPNGSGKSTCVRALLGIASPSQGSVVIDGTPLSQLDLVGWRRLISFLPQRPYLPVRMSVRECLNFTDDTSEDAMVENLGRVGVLQSLRKLSSDPLSVRIGLLSIGERQRIAIARVLARRAPLLVLDEPDANLDRTGTELVAKLVKECAQERMVLIVAHAPELLEAVDRVVTLEAGRVDSDHRHDER